MHQTDTVHWHSDKHTQMAYPQSPSLCGPATVSDANVVGGGGTGVTCCQVGTKICWARLDQACWNGEGQSSHLLIILLMLQSAYKSTCQDVSSIAFVTKQHSVRINTHISFVITSAELSTWWNDDFYCVFPFLRQMTRVIIYESDQVAMWNNYISVCALNAISTILILTIP